MSHTQIGQEDWSCISRMLRAGHSFKEIARTIGKDPSAAGRHIKEYGGRHGYDAHEVRRRKRMKRIAAMDCIRVIKGKFLRFIKHELNDDKSPEQIAGILKKQKRPIDASTIYRYIKERARSSASQWPADSWHDPLTRIRWHEAVTACTIYYPYSVYKK